MVNKVMLLGRLAANPEIITNPDGTPMLLKFTVVTSYFNPKTQQSIPEFHNCTAFNKLADSMVASGAVKDDPIYIEGSLNTRKWVNKDNVTMYSTGIVAREARIIKPKKMAEPAPPQVDFNNFPEKDVNNADDW